MKTFLNVAPSDQSHVMSLGALSDPKTGQLYVPAGKSLVHFSSWLPGTASSSHLVPAATPGVSLTELLTRVSGVIKSNFSESTWVRIEVSQLRTYGKHLYLAAVDRDESGNELAKVNAHIWAPKAASLSDKFKRETGATLTAGIKLLVLARPVFKPQHGLSLEITDIDPSYTLGDMEAKLKRIRDRIEELGIDRRNKELRPPEDFFHVVVLCPEGAAGEGDFRAEADRLEHAGLCRFTYINAVFQGENAKESLRNAFTEAYHLYQESPYCALAVIRGGGASADLHWLNEFSLAGAVCKFPCVVLVGVGHERDKTILDEYAHRSFGTPSKVINYIEAVIRNGAMRAYENWSLILKAAEATFAAAEGKLNQRMLQVRVATERRIDKSTYSAEGLYADVTVGAGTMLDIASERLERSHAAVIISAQSALELANTTLGQLSAAVKERAKTVLTRAESEAQNAFAGITVAARRSIDGIGEHIAVQWSGIVAGVAATANNADREAARHMTDVKLFAGRTLRHSEDRTKELIGGILSHGTGPTLRRGFAIVKADGAPVSSRVNAMKHRNIEIEFRDGTIYATRKDQDD